MSYRPEVREIDREARWTFWKIFPTAIMVIVVLFAVVFGLRSIGLIGGTAVERQVFKHSYQRSSSLEARIAIDQAALEEINLKLANPNLDSNTRANLEAEASAARIRIRAARLQQ
jgi:hypothetical protein